MEYTDNRCGVTFLEKTRFLIDESVGVFLKKLILFLKEDEHLMDGLVFIENLEVKSDDRIIPD